jgi:cytochrome d ubiquinol oxidase subunit I
MAAFLVFARHMIRRGPDLSPAQTEASGSVKNALRPEVMDGAASRGPLVRVPP